MDEQKQSLIDRIKQAQNILVTVSANPSVDQLAAAIGLTIALNKLDKHGTAVFSGQIPDTIEFLKPEETLEKNTNSLRDFIIALDKSKADKLRYKVEDEVVRIFITPYRTSLSQDDLQFSQGDFNVDVVIALGVSEQKDLDAAITAHGRILHDATVATVSNGPQSSLGTLNWNDASASSLSEMVVALVDGLDKKLLDGQIATALLTGIVASTERFSNDKTSPKTMSASAALMAAGANQQLIANELTNPSGYPSSSSDGQPAGPSAGRPDTSMLEIDHEVEGDEAQEQAPPPEDHPQVHVNDDGALVMEGDGALPSISRVRGVGSDGQPTESGNEPPQRERMTEPPQFGDGELTANIEPEKDDPPTEDLVMPAVDGSQLLTHNERSLDGKPEIPEVPKLEAPAPESAMLPPLPPMPVSATPAFAPAAPAEPAFTPPPLPAPVSTPPAFSPTSPPAPTVQPFTLPPAPAAPVFPPPSSAPPVPPPPAPVPPAPASFTPAVPTLTDIETSVHSSHAEPAAPVTPPAGDVDSARSAVEAALNSAPTPPAPTPITALNAQPLGNDLHVAPVVLPPSPTPPPVSNTGFSEPTPGNTPADDALDMPLPSNPFGPGRSVNPLTPTPQAPPTTLPGTPPGGQTPPPPVPPPIFPTPGQ